ncbi:MAG: 50S ribosomal protein L6 [Deltaproteobacteria bacterium]|nr:50S ribosomal protein L6 [Deltaproteobacteria bacterium]
MSRIGKQPVPIPKEVSVDLAGTELTVKGPKGALQRSIDPGVSVRTEEGNVVVDVEQGSKNAKAVHGLFRALIANMVTGVSQGFERTLEIVGVGYRAEVSGGTVVFHLGYSHPIRFELPAGIEAREEKGKVVVSGIDKELVGETAARMRALRKPEPYKGKGVRYSEEMIRRKAGKSAK